MGLYFKSKTFLFNFQGLIFNYTFIIRGVINVETRRIYRIIWGEKLRGNA